MSFDLTISSEVFLSVVIITRNEEFGIKRCLDSVLEELSSFNDWEILLVDSDSSDSTVDIARNYPCHIYRVYGAPLSASLGRAIGTRKSSGKLILYLDGDMELCKNWLKPAIKKLEADHNAAGIIGIRNDIVYNKKKEIINRLSNVYSISTCSKTQHFGGAFLAKKEIIDKIDGFDSRLPSNEEPELHSRIKKAGFYVLQIPKPMIVHHDDSEQKNIKEKVLGAINNRYMGLALGFKYSFSKRNVFSYISRMKEFLIPIFSDLTSYMILVFVFFIGINESSYLIGLILVIQIISFLFSLTIRKPKRFFQSKLLSIGFIRSLFTNIELKYDVDKIS